MELEGKANATFFSTIPSKTLDHHPQHTIVRPQTVLRRDPYPDPEAEPDPDPDPVSTSPPTPPSPPAVSVANRTNQRRRARGETTVRYRGCQKNHAAATGGHVVDGCCEFMPSGEEETPEALKCAACGCHRSFHRRDIDGQDSPAPYMYAHTTSKHVMTPTLYCSGSYRLLQPHAVHRTAEIPRRSYSTEDMNNVYQRRSGEEKGSRKKRFRTKINEEQKEKMKEFAERLGWRMQKKDEEEVDKFCSQVNLRRQVFKVWMHNNKLKRNISHQK
ncbi:PREDICTED: zinc-finger homeodomain protein 7-like [Tarenaya hassleriana]|uniref:zinc-finger homeodomain protein 7-like n=1 Tax=Tarenaya hassleriana TaxID=28532 RepID=UPI00053C2400|nr:PREDICTED: zinc-finger homeodomain protein 7-like [Tarenaya hassleriana]